MGKSLPGLKNVPMANQDRGAEQDQAGHKVPDRQGAQATDGGHTSMPGTMRQSVIVVPAS